MPDVLSESLGASITSHTWSHVLCAGALTRQSFEMTHLRVNSFWTVLRAFSPRGPNRFRFRHTKGKASEVNVRRSLGELEAKLEKRTAERDEALAREAGAAEVLQIINASAGNFAPVLEVILEKALALCAASLGDLSTYDG